MSKENPSKIVQWTPLDSRLTKSTAWLGQPKHVKILFICLLTQKNAHGYVDMSLRSLAREAELTIEETEDALEILSRPYPESRIQLHEGRHIQACETGGWFVLNHRHWRDFIMSQSRRIYKTDWENDKRRKKSGAVAPPGGGTCVPFPDEPKGA